ncbi:sigmaK-factor processing regulatory BofA [Candidatus Woesearchaeota archaeon]|nr:MAG: sigmaK-factor processing regulatory BofA [Candidatus Woesearchaeota archaeon]
MLNIWVILSIVVAVLFAFGLWWLLKKSIIIALNAIIGFFALFALKIFLIPALTINVWSVLIVTIGGLFGLALVLLLHAFGIAF